jgi:hypothetical protein
MLWWKRLRVFFGSNTTRCQIVRQLGEARDASALPLLRAWIAHSNGDVQNAVVDALQVIDPNWNRSPQTRKIIAGLVRRLASAKDHNRVAAEKALNAIDKGWSRSPEARNAVGDLAFRSLTSDSYEVRVASLSALQQIDTNWVKSDEGKSGLRAAVTYSLKQETISSRPGGLPRHGVNILEAIRESGDKSFITDLKSVDFGENPVLSREIQRTLHHLESIG